MQLELNFLTGTEEVADHAVALALTLRRGIALHLHRQRLQPPAAWAHIEHPSIRRMSGSVFGILGLGRIGTATALRAEAFGWCVRFEGFISLSSDSSAKAM